MATSAPPLPAEFLNKGYRVVATVIAESMRNDLAAHPALDIQVVDLGVEEQATAFVASVIKKYQVVDAGLLLVGGFAMGNIAATGMTDIRKQFELNFATAYQVARPLFEHMMNNKKGRLVFIGARPALDAKYGKDLVAYGLSKSLLFKLAEYLNEAGRGFNVTATVVAPSTLDTPLNRKSMPDVDPGIWVKPSALAEILEFIVSDKAHPLRETVLKIYNNA
jgi:NAD(P)-dependent dehydrogenase (short-subunit alcohol dehydrogenase family)